MIKRETGENKILIFDQEEELLTHEELNERLGIDGVIRIQPYDFDSIPDLHTHFNLQAGHHEQGKTYGLIKIMKPGYYIEGGESVLPVLDVHSFIKMKCIEVRDNIPYVELEAYLRSIGCQETIAEVQAKILRRYTKSLPALSEQEILAAGVAVTQLQKVSS